jgi:hypothetical protein
VRLAYAESTGTKKVHPRQELNVSSSSNEDMRESVIGVPDGAEESRACPRVSGRVKGCVSALGGEPHDR